LVRRGRQVGGEVGGAQAGGEGEADGGRHAVTAAEGPGGAVGHDLSGGEHRDPVGEVLGLVHVVGGQEHRLAQGPQAGDDLPGGAPGGGVKAGGGLVQEDQLRVADQGQGEVQPPPLATRQQRPDRVGLVGQADQGDGVLDVAGGAVVAGVYHGGNQMG
jgi:hypothetical protein